MEHPIKFFDISVIDVLKHLWQNDYIDLFPCNPVKG